jgi:cell wall-associated NlpC family hydrolase
MSARDGTGQPAARLIERVLADGEFRARFRRDPEDAARELGIDLGDGAPVDAALQTLEIRESKSSLAGALMAAAAEGVGLYELIQHAGGGLGVEEALAAVPQDNPNISFDATGIADMRSGRVDPRIAAVLDTVAKHHRIGVSSLISDHPVHTTNGSVSNHSYGRAADIATVDGQPVSPGNAAARALAEELLRLDPSIRPTELGSPWDLHDPVAFTDADHQNHIHVAFDDPIKAGRAPPAVTPDDVTGPDDTDASSDADPPDSDPPDSDPPDEREAGDDGDDEEEDSDEDDSSDEDDGGDDDEDEDEDEPDENEVGPDQDDLTDDEVTGEGSDSGDSSDGGSSDGDASDGDSSDGDASDGDSSEGDADGDVSNGDSSDGGGPDGGGAEPDLGDVDAEYPGDDAPRASIAAWMGAEAQRRGLPSELPVMAALVESDLHNLSGGDRDSVGFFQMRTSIWNSGSYVGYADKPELQLDWFLDHAAAVKDQRVAAGLAVDEPKQYGDWIADVERPAEQYRGRYQLRLEDARELLRHDAPSSGSELVGDAADGAARAAGPRAVKAVAEAERYLGTPYHWGGSSPSTGFDCSGLVQWSFAKVGIHLPRTSEEQILAPGGKKVARSNLLPGDLVFFRDSTGDVHHVGISLGGSKFIEAPHTGEKVRISSLKDAYYAEQFTGARRFDAAVSGDGNEARVLTAIRRDQISRRGR